MIQRFILALALAMLVARGETAVIKAAPVDVLSRPAPGADVLATLAPGTVVEVLGHPSPGWLRVALPQRVSAWVYDPIGDPPGKRVRGGELAVRSGPGRNYPEIGKLKAGDSIKVIREPADADGWLQIEPPPGLSGYIESQTQDPSVSPAATMPAESPSQVVKRRPPAPQEPPGTVRTVRQAPVEPVFPARSPQQAPETASSAPRALLSEDVIRPTSPESKPAVSENHVIRDDSRLAITGVQRDDERVGALETVRPRESDPNEEASSRIVTVEGIPAKRTLPTRPVPPVPQSRSGPAPVTMPAYPSSTTVYSSASQTVITYQDSVRRVVRVGKVRLDLAPKSPSYYRLASLNPGEGTLGHLLPGEDGMSFGKFRDTIVRVTGDEFVDAAKPDQAVLLVHSIVPDTGL